MTNFIATAQANGWIKFQPKTKAITRHEYQVQFMQRKRQDWLRLGLTTNGTQRKNQSKYTKP